MLQGSWRLKSLALVGYGVVNTRKYELNMGEIDPVGQLPVCHILKLWLEEATKYLTMPAYDIFIFGI